MSPQGNHLERKARSIKDASKNSNRIPHVCGRESLKMPVADRPPNVCEGHVRQLLFDVNPFRDQAILWFLCVLFELFSKFSTSACARAHTHTHKCTHTRDVRSSERARAHIHTHMHARTHAHAHTHTHTFVCILCCATMHSDHNNISGRPARSGRYTQMNNVHSGQ